MTKNENAYNVVGIVAEYNPFHKGHEYHIKRAKELTGAAACIVVMSGDFVQRGAPSVFDKYTRTAMALNGGADLVLELPSVFATGSAEDFAACGIALLDRLKVVSSICFGSECGELSLLMEAADILAREPAAFVDTLKEKLRCGATFPQARAAALFACGIKDGDILASPNNILGIEYLKAIQRRNSPMRPVTISREGSGYHEGTLPQNTGFSSATAIRNTIYESCQAFPPTIPDSVKNQVPPHTWELMRRSFPVFSDDISLILNAKLLSLSEQGQPFAQYLDVSPELASRIQNTVLSFASFEDRIQCLKPKQYTYTRISRALLHILLDIRSDLAADGRKADFSPYARVLGFRREAGWLLAEIKKRGEIPLITKTADAGRILEETPLHMLQKDMSCSHLYQAVVQNKYQILPKNEYTRSVVIL